MFTGIIEEIGTIKEIKHSNQFVKISVRCKKIISDVKKGDSISVNGICLTVTDFGKDWFIADVMPETLRKSGLGKLKATDQVNLERALRLSDRLGGHIVTGHIDSIGNVLSVENESDAIWITVEAPENTMRYIVMKGSVALDGVSLTVADVGEKSFKVSLIPMTSGLTTLGSKKNGNIINIECDITGKYIEKFLMDKTKITEGKKDISLEFLKENGFA